MKNRFVIGVVLILAATTAEAKITAWNCADDGDGGIRMTPGQWAVIDDSTANGHIPEYRLDIGGDQYFYPAHVEGDFITDTPEDPIVWIVETVDNFTNFTWTDYHIDIGMDKTFSIVGVVAPPDWTWTITQPVSGQPLPGDTSSGTGWVGTVDYYAGTPIPMGGSGQFGLAVQFAGSVAFSTAQIPTPEPASLILLALGSLLLRRR